MANQQKSIVDAYADMYAAMVESVRRSDLIQPPAHWLEDERDRALITGTNETIEQHAARVARESAEYRQGAVRVLTRREIVERMQNANGDLKGYWATLPGMEL